MNADLRTSDGAGDPPATKPGRRQPRAERRAQAISHAADLLHEGGPAALTSGAVAARMGITQSALYRHVTDMDELSMLAGEVVLQGLHERLEAIMLSPGLDWQEPGQILHLCRELIHQMDVGRRDFELVDRWRFASGELGAGVRQLLATTQNMVTTLIDVRWREEFGFDGVLEDRLVVLQHAHACAMHDNALAVARLVRATSPLVDDEGFAVAMRLRVIADFSSFVIDMNERVGLPFPDVDFDGQIVYR